MSPPSSPASRTPSLCRQHIPAPPRGPPSAAPRSAPCAPAKHARSLPPCPGPSTVCHRSQAGLRRADRDWSLPPPARTVASLRASPANRARAFPAAAALLAPSAPAPAASTNSAPKSTPPPTRPGPQSPPCPPPVLLQPGRASAVRPL
ncbi:hypothetical protein J5N97_029761 [Dioscorea zingiberensis]|uniref:Uncharacterized protein n=1 Tax=Dioscorea zingiberensis TaxID=325984 RepID=A0A9D5BWC4_9LILI|nr:hypothetical protein J5N97_029761 [Dioscorea zingiberensis]